MPCSDGQLPCSVTQKCDRAEKMARTLQLVIAAITNSRYVASGSSLAATAGPGLRTVGHSHAGVISADIAV
jgi:hypothetical protein